MKKLTTLVTLLFVISSTATEIKNTFSPEDFDHQLKNGSENEAEHTVLDFDTTMWEGYVSFELELFTHSSETIYISVYDANGKKWTVSDGSSVKTKYFKRLKTPVKITARDVDYSGNRLKFTKVFLEYTKMPSTHKALTGTFGFDEQRIFQFAPYLFGKASLSGSAIFYDNYEAGKSCYRISIIDNDGNSIDMTEGKESFKSEAISLPARIVETPICHSSDLQNPENAERDYELDFRFVDFN